MARFPGDLGAIQMADLVIAAAAGNGQTSVTLEPAGLGHELFIEGRIGGREPTVIPSALADAAVARLALLAGLELTQGTANTGLLSVRLAEQSIEFAITLSHHAGGLGVEARRLAPRRNPSTTSEVLLKPGARIGPYRIVRAIGDGGMGTVLQVIHEPLDRSFAMKVLKPHLLRNPINLTRCFREARAAGKIESPGIVSVTDCGTLEDGRPYLVMELVRWPTLLAVLRNNAFSPTRAAHVGIQLATALHSAHGRGVVHRDIKPANIFLGPDDEVKVGDFGAAKLMNGEEDTEADGRSFFGTAAYASPEQARAMPTDLRSDIYSMGCVLFEMVTGHVPFDAERSVDILVRHVSEAVPAIVAPSGPLAPALDAVIRRALAKDPAHRHQSALALASDLRHAVSIMERKGWRSLLS